MNYETIIGLEVHAQLLTKSKMYCGCSADYANAPPNTHVCPVCLGMPGVLPVINQRAVEFTMMTALALNCTVSEFTKFDRKNYPYPDLMKGYQISQYDAPIGKGGWLNIEVDGQRRKIGITRVHLEEDVAKLLHRTGSGEDYSLVDVNRSGCPLMEIVSEPDLRSPEEARQYLIKLRSILQYLGVSTGNMEEGSFRCDANISLLPEDSHEFTPKVEVKNLNSFKAVFLAMEFEARRQRKAADEGKRLVQETRGWLDDRGRTVSQRSKEYAHDYRYFPEPDLPPLVISRDRVEAIKKELPELPEARRDRYINEFGLSTASSTQITSSKDVADYFEKSVRSSTNPFAIEIGNWILGEASRIVNDNDINFFEFEKHVSPEKFVSLTDLVVNGTITGTIAKPVLHEMFRTGKTADTIIKERGLSQISDTDELEKVVMEVINLNTQAITDYREGKETAIKFLMGQVMKATRGRANPQLVNEVLKKKLAET